MASRDKDDFGPYPYSPLPPDTVHQNVVVLTLYRPTQRRRYLRLFTGATVFILLSAAFFFLYPADPSIQLARLKINRVHVALAPKVVLDLSFSVSVRVRNMNFFSLDYSYLDVSVGYRGTRLGFVKSEEGRVLARTSSYVNATLVLDGFEVIHDVFYLIEDLATGIIPLDTDTEVEGFMGLFFFKIPIKTRVSCELFVNTNDQTIEHQDCYPE